MRRLLFFVFVFPFAIFACGSGSSSSSSPCVATTKTLCTRACACATNGKCVIAYGVGGATEIHESLSACETFYGSFVCAQEQYAKDYDAACGSAIAASTCINTQASGGAIAFPTGCDVTK